MQIPINVQIDTEKLTDLVLNKLSGPVQSKKLRLLAGGETVIMENYDPYTRLKPSEIAKIFRINKAEVYASIHNGELRSQTIGSGKTIQFRVLYKDFCEYQENLISKRRMKQLRESL